MTRSRNGLQKWHRGSTVFLPTSRKIEIAKYACEPSGETVPRAEKFGDLITADHKVFNEESRNNHRYTDNSLEFGKSFEDLSWNHRTSTPHRSETNRNCRKSGTQNKQGTSAVLLQSGLDEKWRPDSLECNCCVRHVQDLLADGKTLHERRFCEPLKGPSDTFWYNG